MVKCTCSIGTSEVSGKHGKDCPCEYYNLLAKIEQLETLRCKMGDYIDHFVDYGFDDIGAHMYDEIAKLRVQSQTKPGDKP